MSQKKNRFGITKISATILALAGMVLLSGCNKNVNAGGEGTNYPYTWQEKNNGTIIVKLDGSYTPDYFWSVESRDTSIVTVDVKKEEKKSIATYVIKPVSEGIATVEFVRKKGENKVNIDYSEPLQEFETSEIKEDQGDDVPLEAPSEFFTEEELAALNEASNAYYENMVSDDVICRIILNIEVTVNDKNKLKATASPSGETMELEGTQAGSADEFNFQYWKESDNYLFLRITDVDETWFVNRESKYDAPEVSEEEWTGYGAPSPIIDENGEEQIIDVTTYGYMDGDAVFTITGIAPGNAKLILNAPLHSKQFVMSMTISDGGVITVNDATVVNYSPTDEEIKAAQWLPEEIVEETSEAVEEGAEGEEGADGEEGVEGEEGTEGTEGTENTATN